MKIIAVAHRSEDHAPEDFAPHLEAESAQSLKLFAAETLREIYSRADGKGAVMVLEAEDEDAARDIVATLPMAKLGLLRFDIYGTKPYRGFVAGVG